MDSATEPPDFHISPRALVARMSSAGGESATYFTEPPDFHISPRALNSQECFLPLRGGFNLRCTRERYIPKNVFFLREKVLIYDAPSLPRKDNRFDQELPSIRGSKVWRKGSRPVAWPDGMVEILVFSYILRPPLEGRALHS